VKGKGRTGKGLRHFSISFVAEQVGFSQRL
jgi:hypothetical protein